MTSEIQINNNKSLIRNYEENYVYQNGGIILYFQAPYPGQTRRKRFHKKKEKVRVLCNTANVY